MEQQEFTCLLERLEVGDRKSLDRLLPLVYDELRRIAIVSSGASGRVTR